MKIIKDNKVYVQRKDLMKIIIGSIHYKARIPKDIMTGVLNYSFYVDGNNMDEFICFEGQENLDFFDKLPYIVDYNKYKELSERDIKASISETMAVISGVCADYNLKSIQRKEESYNTLSIINLLEHKFYDLRTILWEKQGHITIEKPYELSSAYKLKNAFRRNNKK